MYDFTIQLIRNCIIFFLKVHKLAEVLILEDNAFQMDHDKVWWTFSDRYGKCEDGSAGVVWESRVLLARFLSGLGALSKPIQLVYTRVQASVQVVKKRKQFHVYPKNDYETGSKYCNVQITRAYLGIVLLHYQHIVSWRERFESGRGGISKLKFGNNLYNNYLSQLNAPSQHKFSYFFNFLWLYLSQLNAPSQRKFSYFNNFLWLD